ncbi:MAG: flagellar biosynthesis repressor FlbT [Alphaproteobacteria bacterium]|nr:flagellar biosynthesis repressor FlbT [Alphaproteobacteria bacterium]
MALKINVRPGEKLVINGAVITMGDPASYIVLQNQATFLREKDIMQPEEANTPARKIYFSLMLMYLDPEEGKQYYGEFMERMMELMQATTLQDVRNTLMTIFKHVQDMDYFRALKACKALIKFEDALFSEFSAAEEKRASK